MPSTHALIVSGQLDRFKLYSCNAWGVVLLYTIADIGCTCCMLPQVAQGGKIGFQYMINRVFKKQLQPVT